MSLESLADAVGNALISVATTDAWQQARAAIAGLYQRLPPASGETSGWLTGLPEQALATRTTSDASAEAQLRAAYTGHLRRLLRADPDMAGDLQRVLDEVLLPALAVADQLRIQAILQASPATMINPVIVRGQDRRDFSVFRHGENLETEAAGLSKSFAGAIPSAPPAAAPEPERQRQQLISSGFTLPHQAAAISRDATLVAGMTYLYWFEISERSAPGAIDDPLHRELPLEDPPVGTPLTVALFAFPGQLEISPGEDVGEFVVAGDGSVRAVRQPLREMRDWPPEGNRLLFPVRAPDRPGRHMLRASLYCRQTLLQSRLIQAEVAVRPGRAAEPLRSTVDYAVASTLDPAQLAAIKPLRLSILLNDNGDGTHGFRFLGEQDLKGDASLDALQLQDLGDRARRTYRRASWNSDDEWTPESAYVYSKPPGSQRLGDDLIRMARAGYRLWSSLASTLSRAARLDEREPSQSPVRTLQDIMRKPGYVEVASKASARMVVPAAILYDYPLDTNKDLTVCPDASAAITRNEELVTHPCFLGDCASYANDTVVCPGGFWGFRHRIGLPQSRGETGDRAGDEIDAWSEIRCEDKPEFIIGIAQEFAGDHVTRVLGLGDARSEIIADRDQLVAKLREPDFGAHLIYFFCHGALVNGIPAITVGPSGALAGITPDNIQDGTMFWKKTHPLVIINGCSTAALEPHLALNLVDAFVRDAYASGVIGTEVTIFPSLATGFADEFFSRFLGHDEPIGEAVRRSRLSLLAHGNPLGLVYIVFAAPRLLLVP